MGRNVNALLTNRSGLSMVANCPPVLDITCTLRSGCTRNLGEFLRTRFSININLKVVVYFVAECLHKHWQSEDDPVPYGDVCARYEKSYRFGL
jgi:hypothetical protein